MTHEEAIQKLKAAYGERFRMDDDIFPSWVENMERWSENYGMTIEEYVDILISPKKGSIPESVPYRHRPVREYRINADGNWVDD